MDLSVVVVSWNNETEIGECLGSLRARLDGRLAYEVIMVDNASVDATLAEARRALPGAHVIETGANLGFGRAANCGMEAAEGRRILLLNPDCVLGEGLPELLAWLDEHPGVGIATGWIVESDGRVQRNWGRRPPSLWSEILEHTTLASLLPSLFGRHWLGQGDEKVLRFVPAVSGMAMILERALVRRLGGFDPAFFMYLEDFDLCWRARATGVRIARNPVATILHHGGRSARRVGDPSLAHTWPYQSMYLFLRKHRGVFQATAFLALVRVLLWLRLAVLRTASGLRLGGDPEKAASYGAILERLARWDRVTMLPATAQGAGT